MSVDLLRAPTARTFTISELIEHVQNGRVRIPDFQRNFRWQAADVLNLLDSVYKGYPIGSVLFWKKEAPHQVLHLGTLRIEAEATPEALWVVDGQQRITSLAGVLLSVGDVDDPRFAVFFDLVQKKFVRKSGAIRSHWLPMNRVVDTRALLRWLGEVQRIGGTEDWVAAAEDLSRRIREYQIPAYIVETQDERTLRTIFDRLNTFGKALKADEVFQALHGGRRGERPEDLRSLGQQVESLSFGSFDGNSLLRVILALRGDDVYRDFRNEFSDEEDPSQTFQDAGAAIERMIGFLRGTAGVPHIRLLPYRFIIPVLARFFHLHPAPSTRSLLLLRRWLWRDALAAGRTSTPVSVLRQAVRAIGEDEHHSVQHLLAMSPVTAQDDITAPLSARMNEARARAYVAMMASWKPRSLIDGQPIDVVTHFESSATPLQTVTNHAQWRGSLVDRMIHPASAAPLDALLMRSPLRQRDPLSFAEVLHTHGIDDKAVDRLETGHISGFLEMREASLRALLLSTSSRLAEWGASDRPPLAELIVSDTDGDD